MPQSPPRTTPVLPALRVHLERAYTRVVAAVWRVNPWDLFDAEYYLATYDDVAAAGMDPLFHFLRYGAKECRNPHPQFDTRHYLLQNPDVARSGHNPLLHFLRIGGAGCRGSQTTFDVSLCAAENPDAVALKTNSPAHSLMHCQPEERLPAPSYICPLHFQPLTTDGKSGLCPQCEQPFPIEEGIWLLDVVHRGDRTAFDRQVSTSPVPLDLSRAEAMLRAAGIEKLENARILDVGCGLGDLSVGLAASPRILFSSIYAFDHSLESVRIARQSVREAGGNCVYFSTQDASRLCFEPVSFDVIAGSAVLHHITDYAAFLTSLYGLLKPGGVVVFAEPFVEGYLWPSVLLRIALADLKLSRLDAPEFGMCKSIIENTEFRLSHADEPSLLDPLTDKHYFRISRLVDLASDIGYRAIRFRNLAEPAFYNDWMPHFMDVYGIRHKALRERAIELYEELRKTAGPALPDLVSHFRIFSLQK